jgi:hypothetical protein
LRILENGEQRVRKQKARNQGRENQKTEKNSDSLKEITKKNLCTCFLKVKSSENWNSNNDARMEAKLFSGNLFPVLWSGRGA